MNLRNSRDCLATICAASDAEASTSFQQQASHFELTPVHDSQQKQKYLSNTQLNRDIETKGGHGETLCTLFVAQKLSGTGRAFSGCPTASVCTLRYDDLVARIPDWSIYAS